MQYGYRGTTQTYACCEKLNSPGGTSANFQAALAVKVQELRACLLQVHLYDMLT